MALYKSVYYYHYIFYFITFYYFNFIPPVVKIQRVKTEVKTKLFVLCQGKTLDRFTKNSRNVSKNFLSLSLTFAFQVRNCLYRIF